MNIFVISVYAPTPSADHSAKEEFYGSLQAVVNGTSNRDILVIAADWNTPRPAEYSTRHIVGKYTLSQRCENGDQLINFANLNRLCITSTRFQHPREHLITRYSKDGRTAHQIDHILI